MGRTYHDMYWGPARFCSGMRVWGFIQS
jgi:hypothetical protein